MKKWITIGCAVVGCLAVALTVAFFLHDNQSPPEKPDETPAAVETVTFDEKELKQIKKALKDHLVELNISSVGIREQENRIEIAVVKEEYKAGVVKFLQEELPDFDERAILWDVHDYATIPIGESDPILEELTQIVDVLADHGEELGIRNLGIQNNERVLILLTEESRKADVVRFLQEKNLNFDESTVLWEVEDE